MRGSSTCRRRARTWAFAGLGTRAGQGHEGAISAFGADKRTGRRGAARSRRVLLNSGVACADGVNGDTVVIAPPYVITDSQLVELVNALEASVLEVAQDVAR